MKKYQFTVHSFYDSALRPPGYIVTVEDNVKPGSTWVLLESPKVEKSEKVKNEKPTV